MLTWGGSLTGTFKGAPNAGSVDWIAYELTDNPNFDLQAEYDTDHKVMNLVVVANQERTAEPEPEPEPTDPEPTDPTPTDPTDPTPEPTEPTPEPTVPTTPERAGEQPLLSGTGKLALADFAHDTKRAQTERTVICGDNGRALWASLLGSRGHLAGDGSTLGYTAEHAGVAVGTEVCAGQTRGGVMLAAGHNEAKDREATVKHELTANTWLVGLYGEHDLTDRVTLDANVGVGRSRVKGERQFVTEGLTAESRTHASLYQAGVGVAWKATEWLTPFARLDYTRVTMKGFTENGANEHNQHVSRDAVDELVARVGTQITTPLTSRLRFSARVSAGVDLLDSMGTTHARFVDGSGEVAMKNGARSRVVGDMALGLAYQVTPNWALSTSVTGEARRHQREGAVDVRSTWTF